MPAPPAVTAPEPQPAWMAALNRVNAYTAEHGHARVPQGYITADGFRLGKWVHNQRTAYRARTSPSPARRTALSDAQVARLEQVPGWTWNTRPSTRASVKGTPLRPVPARPRRERTLSAAEFDRRIERWVHIRALRRWLDERAATGNTTPFSEDDLVQDQRLAHLAQEESIRAAFAGLLAAGEVLGWDGSRAPLTWEAIVSAPTVPADWSFRLAVVGSAAHRPIPVRVADAYRRAADGQPITGTAR